MWRAGGACLVAEWVEARERALPTRYFRCSCYEVTRERLMSWTAINLGFNGHSFCLLDTKPPTVEIDGILLCLLLLLTISYNLTIFTAHCTRSKHLSRTWALNAYVTRLTINFLPKRIINLEIFLIDWNFFMFSTFYRRLYLQLIICTNLTNWPRKSWR